jgi:hypothetical protein
MALFRNIPSGLKYEFYDGKYLKNNDEKKYIPSFNINKQIIRDFLHNCNTTKIIYSGQKNDLILNYGCGECKYIIQKNKLSNIYSCEKYLCESVRNKILFSRKYKISNKKKCNINIFNNKLNNRNNYSDKYIRKNKNIKDILLSSEYTNGNNKEKLNILNNINQMYIIIDEIKLIFSKTTIQEVNLFIKIITQKIEANTNRNKINALISSIERFDLKTLFAYSPILMCIVQKKIIELCENNMLKCHKCRVEYELNKLSYFI